MLDNSYVCIFSVVFFHFIFPKTYNPDILIFYDQQTNQPTFFSFCVSSKEPLLKGFSKRYRTIGPWLYPIWVYQVQWVEQSWFTRAMPLMLIHTHWVGGCYTVLHPLLKTTLTGLRRTYLRFLVFRPKLGETKRFPPFLDHMNGKFFLGGSRFRSGKIDPKLAVGGCVAAQPWSGALSKIDNFGPKTSTFWHKKSEKKFSTKKIGKLSKNG